MIEKSEQINTESNFQVQEIEGLTKVLIKSELEKQKIVKLSKIESEIQTYQQKLAEIVVKIGQFEAQRNNTRNDKVLKELRSKESFYSNHLKHLKDRGEKTKLEYEQVINSNANNEDQQILEDFFSHNQENKNVEKKHQKSLLEITIDGYEKYYVSELFHSLLFKHQVEALYWLLSQHSHGKGSILADEMGLGKTISAIALMTTLYTTYWEQFNRNPIGNLHNKIGPFLVVCPATVISQWVQELKLWTSSMQKAIPILTFQGINSVSEDLDIVIKRKSDVIDQAFKHNGIVITSYEYLRSEIHQFQRRSWFYIILDEAQKIKNSQSQIHSAVTTLQAQRRLILSGTPMQNNLAELWSLFNFVQPGLLGELDYFENTFCKAIVKGGYTNATAIQQETSRHCLIELRDIIQRHILRRTKKQLRLECHLPERNEYIVFCNLTQAQLRIYERYLKGSQEFLSRDYNKPEALNVLNNLRKICNHPFFFFAYHESPKSKLNGYRFHQQSIANIPEFVQFNDSKERASRQFKDLKTIESQITSRFWQMSGKLKVLVNFLKEWQTKDPTSKVLIFSQTKKMLDVIELLAKQFEFSHLRMDGDINLKTRMELIEKFNHEDHFLFLLTTKVGGLGINLTAANKVIIFDPDWNPMNDLQATDRALRIGQKRDVTIYRFIVDDSIEEKIYHRQVFKKFMADKVLQDPSKQKLFERSTMHELFELPQKSIDRNKEEQTLLQLRGKPQSLSKLKEEVKSGSKGKFKIEQDQDNDTNQSDIEDGQINDDGYLENPEPSKMYKVSKRNIKRDEKLQQYFKKAEKELKQVDQNVQKAKADLEADLISQIFKQPEETESEKLSTMPLPRIRVKMEAMKAASELLQNIGGSSVNIKDYHIQQEMSSSQIIANLMRKKAKDENKNSINEANKINLKDQIVQLYKERETYEITTDEILDKFKDFIHDDDFIDSLKKELKNIAFFDKKDKIWILKD